MTIAPSHSNGLFPTYKNAFSLIYIITHRHMIVKIICIKRLYVMGKNGNKVSPSDSEEHRFLSVHWLKRQHLPLGFGWSWCLVPAGSGCVLRLSSWLLIQLWQDRPFENETFSNRRFPTKRLIKSCTSVSFSNNLNHLQYFILISFLRFTCFQIQKSWR